jgi:POT family proton-dependent oligopeptide transporter
MGNPEAPARDGDRAFFGHPRGLATLFFTEMWERFSYYGMRAFLIYYLVTPTEAGGMGMLDATGGIILGCYTASVYLMSVPGGWIADRFLGLRRAVLIGGILIMSGHLVLALPVRDALYLGLFLIVLGTGLLKPNISAMVGQLYDANDKRRDSGYSIYYMGINLGAFGAPLLCGWLAQSATFRGFLGDVGISPNASWHVAFGMAALGMFFGLVQYALGTRHLNEAGAHPTPPKSAAEASRNNKILIGIIVGIAGFVGLIVGLVQAGVLADEEAVGNMFGGLLTLLSITLFTALFIKGCQNADERRRLTLILLLFFGATIFWGCFEQASGVLSLFAEDLTDRHVFGMNIPASWFQSINAMFIIIFAPVFGALWFWMAKRNAEPTAPAKFGTGLVLTGLGFAVMIPAAIAIDGDAAAVTSWIGATDKHLPLVSPWFLISLYLLHTFAELCISPVGLSSMSKLAPARWGGLVMGIWFLGAANGNFLAGKAVKYSSTMANTPFFEIMVAAPIAFSLIFFVLVKPIGRMLARSTPATGE